MENRGKVYSCFFLDDGLGAAADYTKARISSLSVHADLFKSGFVPNEQKSLLSKLNISLRRTAVAVPDVVRLRESSPVPNCLLL